MLVCVAVPDMDKHGMFHLIPRGHIVCISGTASPPNSASSCGLMAVAIVKPFYVEHVVSESTSHSMGVYHGIEH